MVVMSRARSRDCFEDRDCLVEHLATQLAKGRLALVLGAGVSMAFGLPSWERLVDRCFTLVSTSRPTTSSLEASAEYLFTNVFKRDRLSFAEHVRRALFQDFDFTMNGLRKNALLGAIGAMAMVSSRGSVAQIVSFNYDDVLERFLFYHGVDVESIDVLPAWTSSANLVVYHPHGLLSVQPEVVVKRGIVFTELDYDQVVGNIAELWNTVVRGTLCSSTCLLIGLSGNDKNLKSSMAYAKEHHVSVSEKHAFWGVRFSDNVVDPQRGAFEERGVFQVTRSHAEIPAFLFEICQKARELNILAPESPAPD